MSWQLAIAMVVGLAILQAALVALQTWEHRRYARRRLSQLPHCRPRGRALVIVPCRGSEHHLADNLRMILQQDYDDYQVRFVVESESDPAAGVIRQLMAEHLDVPSRLVVAGAAEACGQKVHNLLAATAKLPQSIEYLAFADSDARPARHWLRALLGRLGRPQVGAVTGYRWFVPVRPSLAAHVLYSINCGMAVMLAAKVHHFVWGGTWALRRDRFDSLGLRRAWQGALSDDLVAARVLGRSGLKVAFEPACMVASPLEMNATEVFAFVRRQYLIARNYVPGWWAFALAAVGFSGLAMLAGVVAVAVAWCTAASSAAWMTAALAALYGIHLYRGRLRKELALRYFPLDYGPLVRAARFDVWAAPLVGALHWLILLTSAAGHEVRWRGIHYRLQGAHWRPVRRRAFPSLAQGEEAAKTPPPVLLPGRSYRKAG